MSIGCVGYLNSLPLIEGLAPGSTRRGQAGRGRWRLYLDAPSRLLAGLEGGQFDVGLCPVIDAQRSAGPLAMIPAGGIGCHGRTLTVRLFSRVDPARVDTIHADTDSHTSIVLLRILLDRCHGRRPQIHPLDGEARGGDWPEAMLLIGDKVVTDPPPESVYTHQVDLGELWYELTGLPFVFAVWMVREGTDPGRLPRVLSRLRDRNLQRIDAIVDRHAASHGWPIGLARAYLGRWLRYRIGREQLEAIRRFWHEARTIGAIDSVRPVSLLAAETGDGLSDPFCLK